MCVCSHGKAPSICPCIFHTHSQRTVNILYAIFGRRRSAWDNKPPPPLRFNCWIYARARERRRMNFQQNDMIPLLLYALLVNKLNKHTQTQHRMQPASPCPSKTKVSLMAQLHFPLSRPIIRLFLAPPCVARPTQTWLQIFLYSLEWLNFGDFKTLSEITLL
jgi:hypothetical protein